MANAEEKVQGGNEGVGVESTIYQQRFTSQEEECRRLTWEVLCREFLQRYVSELDTVVDIGAGDGLFIKNIRAKRKIAVDLSEHVGALRAAGVEVLQIPATQIAAEFHEKADVVFMSNFLEHLPTKKILLDVIQECRAILKPGASLIILQPNIRYVGAAYWDYIDHHIALTEHSLTEALETSGFEIVRMIPRFLPYTAKSSLISKLPTHLIPKIVSWYLRLPLAWHIFGQQTFVVATPKRSRTEKRKNV